MAVRAELPIRGVDVILGNDLVPDGRMWPDDVRPVLIQKPQDLVHQPELACPPCSVPFEGVEILKSAGGAVQGPAVGQGGLTPQESESGPSAVCAVTRAMAAALPDSGVVMDKVKTFTFSVPNDLCVSRVELVHEQRKDPSLTNLYDLVVPSSQVGTMKQGYVLQDEVLFRVWAPHGEGFGGDSVRQVVLPAKFRTSVIQTAHDNVAGHMGVKKTYHKLLQHFFWPRIKRDVSNYIKTCQVTSKPNQPNPISLAQVPISFFPTQFLFHIPFYISFFPTQFLVPIDI